MIGFDGFTTYNMRKYIIVPIVPNRKFRPNYIFFTYELQHEFHSPHYSKSNKRNKPKTCQLHGGLHALLLALVEMQISFKVSIGAMCKFKGLIATANACF